jgi:hypothetical protein
VCRSLLMQTNRKHTKLFTVIATSWLQSQTGRIHIGETKTPPFSLCQSGKMIIEKTCNTMRNFRNAYQGLLNKFQVGELR